MRGISNILIGVINWFTFGRCFIKVVDVVPYKDSTETYQRLCEEVESGYRFFASRAADFEHGAYRRSLLPGTQPMQDERNRNGLDRVRNDAQSHEERIKEG